MAFAFGRSIVTSSMLPSLTILTPSDMADLLLLLAELFRRINASTATAPWPAGRTMTGIHVDFDERAAGGRRRSGRRPARHRSAPRYRPRGLPRITRQELRDLEAAQAPLRSSSRVNGGSSVTLSASSSVNTPPAPSTRTWPNCGSTIRPIENLGDAVAGHLLDQQRLGQRAQALRGGRRLGGVPDIERDAADLGLVLEMRARRP